MADNTGSERELVGSATQLGCMTGCAISQLPVSVCSFRIFHAWMALGFHQNRYRRIDI